MAGSFDLLFSWKMMRAWKGEKKMKKIVPSAAAALVFVLITLLYYRIAAAMSNRFFQSELSTDMWVGPESPTGYLPQGGFGKVV